MPHEYVEFKSPVKARYLKLENIHMPSGKFAVSGLRAFGIGPGPKPEPVKNFIALRGNPNGQEGDRRNAWLKWQVSDDATGYLIRCGIAPDKMYTSVMVYGSNEYYFKAMDRDRVYYFQIEAFNEAGISARSQILKSE